MWTEIKSFFGFKDTAQKIADLEILNEELHDIEKSLDVLAADFTEKNESKKILLADPNLEKSLHDVVNKKYNSFLIDYEKDLEKAMVNRRLITNEINQIKADPDVIKYLDNINAIKKAYLDGKIHTDLFLDILESNRIINIITPEILEKADKKQQQKISQVMREYDAGKLKTGSGGKVKNKKQALAIALSEAGLQKADLPSVKKEDGVPIKYLEGLKGESREKRIKEIKDNREKQKEGDKSVYNEEQWKTSELSKANKGLTELAEDRNAPLSALRKIYNKGLAAWGTGHRPGINQHAWAMARVKSVLSGGKARSVDAEEWKEITEHRKKVKKSFLLDEDVIQDLFEKANNDGKPGNYENGLTLQGIAQRHKVAPEVIQRQMQIGIKEEMEHTNSKELARKIALDHLYEVHDYYTRLQELKEDHDRDMEAMNKGEHDGKTEEHEGKAGEHDKQEKESEGGNKEHDTVGNPKEMEKADYYIPPEDVSVNNDKGEDDTFLTKGWHLIGYNINTDHEIDSLDFEYIQETDLDIEKADVEGKDVPLGKPMRGDVKKYKVYVKNDKGNVVKVNFGDPNMEIKRDDPDRRRSFRARHKCDQATDRTSPRYWSCKFWSKKPVSSLMKSLDQIHESGLIETFEYHELIEKAKSGVYADNEYNRRLGRVGEKYGKEKDKKKDEGADVTDRDRKDAGDKKEKEDKPEKVTVVKPKDTEEKPVKPVMTDVPNDELKKLKEAAKKSSAAALQATIKQSNDAKLRAVAQEELNRRKQEEIATKSI